MRVCGSQRIGDAGRKILGLRLCHIGHRAIKDLARIADYAPEQFGTGCCFDSGMALARHWPILIQVESYSALVQHLLRPRRSSSETGRAASPRDAGYVLRSGADRGGGGAHAFRRELPSA